MKGDPGTLLYGLSQWENDQRSIISRQTGQVTNLHELVYRQKELSVVGYGLFTRNVAKRNYETF